MTESCLRCCRSPSTGVCMPVKPTRPLPEGSICIHGHCKSQICVKEATDAATHFWRIIKDIGANPSRKQEREPTFRKASRAPPFFSQIFCRLHRLHHCCRLARILVSMRTLHCVSSKRCDTQKKCYERALLGSTTRPHSRGANAIRKCFRSRRQEANSSNERV